MTHCAYVGVGANLGDAAAAVRAALRALTEIGVVRAASHLYRTTPWGVREQPDFINAVALLETTLEPRDLLAALKRIEVRLGRSPARRWGPRAIDLDLLTYDAREIEEADLVVPHPRLRERAFVLIPLAEIDAAYAPLAAALPQTEAAGVARIGDAS